MFILVLSGCGYKASPYYEDELPLEDKNVKFIVIDNNESGK